MTQNVQKLSVRFKNLCGERQNCHLQSLFHPKQRKMGKICQTTRTLGTLVMVSTIVIYSCKTNANSTGCMCDLFDGYAKELVLFGKRNVDPLLEASQECRVNFPGTIGSTHQEYLLVTLVNLCQELCFHSASSKHRSNYLAIIRSVQQYKCYTTHHISVCFFICV
jgi:hypothetical protein